MRKNVVFIGIGLAVFAATPIESAVAQSSSTGQDVVKSKALADAAVEALKSKDNDRALDLSARALAIQANVNTLFIHGTACANVRDWTCAIADFDKAKSIAVAGRADARTLNAIDANTAKAYLFGGRVQAGIELGIQVKSRDPASAVDVDRAFAGYFNNAAIEKIKAGDVEGAEALLEQGAQIAPTAAAALYVQAANALSREPQANWPRVEAEAQKALAVSPEDARANYVVGIAKANSGDKAGAIPFLQKARANAGDDASLRGDTDSALKKLGAE